jgi:hypothetical protein
MEIVKLFSDPIIFSMAIAGLIGITYLVLKHAGDFKLGGLQVQGRVKVLNEDIRHSMKLWDVMRADIWELYLPIQNFILASVCKSTNDPLLSEIVDRQLNVEVWRHFRKRFFENHFYEVLEEPARLKGEVGELAINMRQTLINALQVKRLDRLDILAEKDMETLRGLIERAISKLHTTKRLLAKDWGTNIETVNSSLRRQGR